MRAVEVVPDGADGGLRLVEVPAPRPGPGEIAIDVVAAGVNRADTGQRRGRYGPPPGASPFPGLECSGVVAELGPGVRHWRAGDAVCALLAGGGYAERVVVPDGQVLPAPSSVSLLHAAAMPETLATVWSNLVHSAGLAAGEVVLVHGGASGIGTASIQVARLMGAVPVVTAGGPAKAEACLALGAAAAIDYRQEDFVERVLELTGGRGVDVVLDIVGADYLGRNVAALAPGGRLVVIGLQSGNEAVLDLRELLSRHAVVTGSMLRSRSVDEKAAIVRDLAEHVWPAVERGAVHPVVDSVFPLDDAIEAHRRLEASEHVGKIVLDVRA